MNTLKAQRHPHVSPVRLVLLGLVLAAVCILVAGLVDASAVGAPLAPHAWPVQMSGEFLSRMVA